MVINPPSTSCASHRLRLRMLLFGGFAAAAGAFAVPGSASEIAYVTADRLIDPVRGSVIDQPALIVRDGTVVASGTQAELPAPEGAKAIDLGRRTILPGLIDMHTHITMDPDRLGLDGILYPSERPIIRAIGALERTLKAGFTTIRNLGDQNFGSLSLRDAVNDGDIVGPRIFDSGPPIGILGGYCSDNNRLPYQYHDVRRLGVATGPWEMRERVREHIKYHVDLIKTCTTAGIASRGVPQETFEELAALVDEAHTRGYKVAVHAHGVIGIKNAIRAGVDTIEHATFIDDEDIRMARERGIFLTINLYSGDFALARHERDHSVTPQYLAEERQAAIERAENFRKAVKAGAKVLFGTDAGNFPHGNNAKQFSLMVRYGMTPMQAIQSATSLAAQALGKSGVLGCLSANCTADLIAVDGDPTKDIRSLESVGFVMKDGENLPVQAMISGRGAQGNEMARRKVKYSLPYTRIGMAVAAALFGTSAASSSQVVYITADRLIDPAAGTTLKNAAVVVRDGKIVATGSKARLRPPEGARRVDLPGKTILPGLIDMHTHVTMNPDHIGLPGAVYPPERPIIWAVVALDRTLKAGFTTIRNVGDMTFGSVALRDAINDGDIIGPHMLDSGPPIGILGGYCSDNNLLPYQYHDVRTIGVASGPWGMREKVREHIKYHVDLIKTCSSGGLVNESPPIGTSEELAAIVDEAHMRGYKVAVHALGAVGIKNAIEAGADTIEHATFIDDEDVRLAKQHGVYLSINIYSSEYNLKQEEGSGLASPQKLRDERDGLTAKHENFRKAVRAGAKVIFGTDAGNFPHGDNAKQFPIMVRLGMSPMQAIQSATSLAAEALDRTGLYGCISANCSADIIAVDGNPLDDISLLQSVRFVMKDGHIYRSE